MGTRKSWILRCDGAARGNPGPAAIGLVVEDPEGAVILRKGECIGSATNNVAEYRALIAGLEWLVSNGAAGVLVLCDSLLVVQQVRGIFKVKNAGLRPLHGRVKELQLSLQELEIRHVPREDNAAADALANEALDSAEDEWPEQQPDNDIEQRRLFL